MKEKLTMNDEQADKLIAQWRVALQQVDIFLHEQLSKKEFEFRWATIDGKRHVVEYYNDDRIFMCGNSILYQMADFDSLGEYVR